MIKVIYGLIERIHDLRVENSIREPSSFSRKKKKKKIKVWYQNEDNFGSIQYLTLVQVFDDTIAQ